MVYQGKSRYRGRRRTVRRTAPSGRRTDNRESEFNISGKLAASLWILFLAVALRVLFPQQVESVKDSVLEVMAGDVDYKAAIAVMGEAVRGERGFGDAISAAYDYAFTGSTDEVETMGGGEDASEVGGTETVPAEHETVLPDNVCASKMDIGIDGIAPVSGTVTSSFGMREHPTDGELRFHYGTDIDAQMGDDVVSFADGTVYASGDSTGYGLYLIVDHGSGVQTMYAHLSEMLVTQGETVASGQIIARVGDTGNATSPCLHFEVTKDGMYLDPEYYIG